MLSKDQIKEIEFDSANGDICSEAKEDIRLLLADRAELLTKPSATDMYRWISNQIESYPNGAGDIEIGKLLEKLIVEARKSALEEAELATLRYRDSNGAEPLKFAANQIADKIRRLIATAKEGE